MEGNSQGTALLIVAILSSGYILATFCYYFRYKTARESGHRLYLTSASLGLVATFTAELVLLLIHSLCFFLHHLPWVKSEVNLFDLPHDLLLTVFTPVCTVIYCLIYNSRTEIKSRNLRRAWGKDDFSALLDYATQTLKPIAATLESRKVYVGLVAITNEPDSECSHLTLLPYYSGFRDQESLHLSITNKYNAVFDYFESDFDTELPIEDLYIVLPLNRIVSSHIFNADVYDSLNKENPLSTK